VSCLAVVLTVLAVVLTVIGGILPVAAIAWAWVVTRRRFRVLNHDLTLIHAIAQAHPEPSEATPLMEAVRMPTATNTTVLYGAEEVERAILGSALKDLKGPALLAGAGALAGMVGSLLAFGV
jgi:hypothetical protein